MVWSDEKTIALIELVGANYHALFLAKRSDLLSKTACDRTWANLTDILNARFPLELHSEAKVRNKWKNMKQAAMQYDASRKDFASIPGGSLVPRNSLFDLVLQASHGGNGHLLQPPSIIAEHELGEVKIEESPTTSTTMDDVVLGAMAGTAHSIRGPPPLSLCGTKTLSQAQKRPPPNPDPSMNSRPAEKQPIPIEPAGSVPAEELQRRLLEKQLENAGKMSNLLDKASEFFATGSDLMRSFMASKEMDGRHTTTTNRPEQNGTR